MRFAPQRCRWVSDIAIWYKLHRDSTCHHSHFAVLSQWSVGSPSWNTSDGYSPARSSGRQFVDGRLILIKHLDSLGFYDVDVAEDGRSALECLSKRRYGLLI